LLTLVAGSPGPAVQRKPTATSTRFRAAQYLELACQPGYEEC